MKDYIPIISLAKKRNSHYNSKNALVSNETFMNTDGTLKYSLLKQENIEMENYPNIPFRKHISLMKVKNIDEKY